MGKKKKKSQKKIKVDTNIQEDEQPPDYSLDNALKSAKTTETTLQTLLRGVAKGDGFIQPQTEHIKVTPQLSHESKSKIAEAYVLEDVPLTEQVKDKSKSTVETVSIEKKMKSNRINDLLIA